MIFLARRLRWLPHDLGDMSWEQLVFWHEAALQEAKAEQEYIERERAKNER